MENNIEIWRPVVGYEDCYMVSSLGRVKSLGNGKSNNSKVKILKPSKNKYGYLKVGLFINGIRKELLIHRLVAQAFIPNTENLPEINHIDENKENNCVDNLEWCTTKYNCNYGTRTERSRIKRLKPILQFTKIGEFVRKWDSAMQVERELGFYQTNITRCCKGKLKSTHNYKWGYAKDYERILFKVFDLEIYEKKVA